MFHRKPWPYFAGLLLLLAGLPMAEAVTLKPVQVAPQVYAFIGEMGNRNYENEGLNANTGFIVTPAGVVVVDSGSSYRVAQQIHRAIQTVTKQPVRYVINTGGQDHRWLGNGYFRQLGVEVIAQRKAVEDMAARGADQIAGLTQDLKDRIAGTQVALPNKIFDTTETLRLGGIEIRILYFQGGHTPGDSVVWLPQSRTLFSGDLIFVDRLLGVLPVSNTRAWLASFEALEKLNPKVIVPGHGNVCDLAKARRDTKDYLVLLRTHMSKAVAEGKDIQTAIDTLDQRRFQRLLNYDALKGGNANRTYLEIEAE